MGAARKELIKRKQWKRQRMVVAKVAAVEADESQAEAELDSVKKKEAVWQGFVDSTQGAAKQHSDKSSRMLNVMKLKRRRPLKTTRKMPMKSKMRSKRTPPR